MAKQTGQITYQKNNQIVNFEKTVRFIFTKENGERITRDTTAKGVINFDIPIGDWNVSWFAVDGDQKVLPLRAGLQLKITSSTPTTALADWIYGDNTHVADPILSQWTAVLDEMKSVRDQFRDETSFVGNPDGKIMKQGASGIGGRALLVQGEGAKIRDVLDNKSGLFINNANDPRAIQNSAGIMFYHYNHFVTFFSIQFNDVKNIQASIERDTGVYSVNLYNTGNTQVGNHGQIHAGEGRPKELLGIGDYGFASLTPNYVTESDEYLGRTGFRSGANVTWLPQQLRYSTIIESQRVGTSFQLTLGHRNHLASRVNDGGTGRWNYYHGEHDTIIDSNGNYKSASPVIQLHHNRVEYNEDFDKDNPPKFEHLETGVYRITNVREICKDGWTFNKPNNGKSQPYFMIKYEQEDATTLLVRVFERTFDKNTGEFGFGEPRDIGADERWIDFHFEVDHERIAREEAQMQKEQEEFEEQERLRKEAEELAEKEAQEAWEAEMAKHEAEMLAEMEAEHKEE